MALGMSTSVHAKGRNLKSRVQAWDIDSDPYYTVTLSDAKGGPDVCLYLSPDQVKQLHDALSYITTFEEAVQ